MSVGRSFCTQWCPGSSIPAVTKNRQHVWILTRSSHGQQMIMLCQEVFNLEQVPNYSAVALPVHDTDSCPVTSILD